MGRRLAESIQHALVRRLGLPDGGLHPRSIAILRETRMPAARIEPAVALDELDASRIAEAGVRGRRGTRHRGRGRSPSRDPRPRISRADRAEPRRLAVPRHAGPALDERAPGARARARTRARAPCRRAGARRRRGLPSDGYRTAVGSLGYSLMLEGQEGVTWSQWLAIARTCERLGFDGLLTSDHYLSVVHAQEPGSNDAWTLLGALAASTERLRLGTMVSPVTFRLPAVLAKAATTVDRISGGRVRARHGCGVVGPGAPDPRDPLPPDPRTVRDARGAARDRARPVVRGGLLVRGALLRARGVPVPPQAHPATASPDRAGGQGRTEARSAGGALGRRVQPRRRDAGRAARVDRARDRRASTGRVATARA